jgi:hypothetical protein
MVRKGKSDKRREGWPPRESELWPASCRGEYWDERVAVFYVGHCQMCTYAAPPSEGQRFIEKKLMLPTFLLCTNHPDHPQQLRDVMPTQTCRNFKMKAWRPVRRRSQAVPGAAPGDGADPSVRRVPVGHGLFALVDAADYEEVSRHRWHTIRKGSKVYACCHQGRKLVSMHRMIMRPRTGYVVDHIDGNGLNNRRCNLRECTARQNRANTRPRGGSSRFVGVYRRRDKWVAGLQYRGKYYYLGLFKDEVEAAKARDRKAYELLGAYAYLNFPEDFPRPGGARAR